MRSKSDHYVYFKFDGDSFLVISLYVDDMLFISTILKRFNMQDSRPLSVPVTMGTKLSSSQCPTSPLEMEEISQVPYKSVVGSLMYAMVYTRPDITQVVGVLSCYISNPGRAHWDAVKRVFRYLQGTSEYSICFHGTGYEHSPDIRGYVDSD